MKRMSASEKRVERRLAGVAVRQGLRVRRDDEGYFLTALHTGRNVVAGDAERMTLQELHQALTGPRRLT